MDNGFGLVVQPTSIGWDGGLVKGSKVAGGAVFLVIQSSPVGSIEFYFSVGRVLLLLFVSE